MTSERRGAERAPEISIEGLGLVVLAAVLLALLGGAFLLGRWYERGRGGAEQATARALDGSRATGERKPLTDVDVDRSADFFDDASGAGKQLEPQRQASPPPAAARPEPQRTPPPTSPERAQGPGATAQGDLWVQVAAGRDRAASEVLATELRAAGFAVTVFREAEGAGALYRVRVGPYANDDAAGAAVRDLRGKGHDGAWVVRP